MGPSERKFKFYFEKLYPYVFSLVIEGVFIFMPSKESFHIIFTEKLISSVFTISGIIFGFLLTVLALLVQANNPTMKRVRFQGRFNELISYNKQAVFSSLICLAFSTALLTIDSLDKAFLCYDKNFFWVPFLYSFSVLIMIFNTFRYTDIFYTLIKE